MRCLLMRNLLTFSTKKSHMSRYLKSSLLTSLYRFIHQDARRLLMSDLFVEKVSRFLMRRHLISSHLKKKKRRLLMRCLLIDTWTGLLSFNSEDASHLTSKDTNIRLYNILCNAAKISIARHLIVSIT